MIQKTAESTGDLIGNKIADRITKVSKTSHRIIQEKILNMIEKYIERYISLVQRQKMIDDLRLISK